jgi:hypothetical protein
VTAINGGERLHMIWEGKPVPPSPTGRTLIWSGRPDGPDITEWLPTDPVEIMGGLTATMEQFKLRLGATDGELGLVEFPPMQARPVAGDRLHTVLRQRESRRPGKGLRPRQRFRAVQRLSLRD